MKNIFFIICLVIPVLAQAGGPGMPNGYRMPNNEELSSSERDIDKYRYSMVAGDFNGDGLVDGAFLSISNGNKEVAVFVFLSTHDDQVFKWYKVGSFEYHTIKYTGIRLLKPQKILFYPDVNREGKKVLSLSNDSLELFKFEGSSSVNYYEKGSDRFKQAWISKEALTCRST